MDFGIIVFGLGVLVALYIGWRIINKPDDVPTPQPEDEAPVATFDAGLVVDKALAKKTRTTVVKRPAKKAGRKARK